MEDVRDEEKKSDENENLALYAGHKWVTLSAMALVWQGKRKDRGTFSWLWVCVREDSLEEKDFDFMANIMIGKD